MPCNMMEGITSADIDAGQALRRVAALEEALCGLCQRIFYEDDKYADLQSFDLAKWFSEHKKHKGCSAK